MKATRLAIPDVILLEPTVHEDDRGFFFESYNQRAFEQATGLSPTFVQDNHSKSRKGVLRGLHYQLPPKAQAKLVRVIQGEVFDVVVDIRKDSPTFGKWISEVLTGENKKQIWVPEGFAHAFLALTEGTELVYKTTDYYSSSHERCILWKDETLEIKWPEMSNLEVSERDEKGTAFSTAEIFQ